VGRRRNPISVRLLVSFSDCQACSHGRPLSSASVQSSSELECAKEASRASNVIHLFADVMDTGGESFHLSDQVLNS
jgi:hypothetical protein